MNRNLEILGRRAAFLLLACAGRLAGAPIDFQRDIQPILADNCFPCHGPDAKARKADLRFDTREGAFRLRQGKAVIVPGKSAGSELVRRISSGDADEKMPPPESNRRLTSAQVDLLRMWIDQGAAWGRHWSFAPPRRPELPAVRDAAWPCNPIDRFILARLEAEGLGPSPEAPREALLRRAAFDLTGLPPSVEEIEALLSDPSPDAYEKAVGRLLASPRYGERMAWDWLDAARYADTNGYQGDNIRTMWPWRDWVIDAFNADMPFDRFTIEQLAGDLLPDASPSQVLATGFHRNHMINGEGGRIAEESRVDYVVDRTDTTASVWLGLTLGCARCHDHKYDPLAQKEYYGLFAYFNNVPESGGVDEFPNGKPVLRVPSAEQSAAIAGLESRIQGLKSGIQQLDAGDPARRAELQKQLDEAQKALKETDGRVPRVMVFREMEKPRDTFVLLRGAYDKHGDKVEAGVPAILRSEPSAAPQNRLGLARWLMDRENPLTARVIVNRHWQMIFGSGLVKTTEDFGVQGERPSHPELLDWLACELMDGGWDIKTLLRLLVTSAAYRQSSRVTPALLERDPENRLLGRSPRFRLSSAMIRDQALLAAGLLVERTGGPPVKPYQPPGVWEDMSFGQITYSQDRGENLYRRSLYTFWRRSVGPTLFFDAATRQTCAVRVARTNSPLHALITLNDVTFIEAARKLAERVLAGGGPGGDAGRIESLFRLCISRPPRPAERDVLLGALARLKELYSRDAEAAGKLLSAGESPRRPGLETAELAAYTGAASLILNLDEAINKE